MRIFSLSSILKPRSNSHDDKLPGSVMKTRLPFILILGFAGLIGMIGCSKSYNYPSTPLSAYMPLQVGKYITYRLDSLVFIQFGTMDTTVSYLAKDVIEDSISDNEGRPSLRVVRYLNDTAASRAMESD